MCSVNTTTLEINVLLQHVSTQESHSQVDYLRTVNTLYLYSIIHVTIALGIPYVLQWVSRKPGFVTNLDKSILCAAVGVDCKITINKLNSL